MKLGLLDMMKRVIQGKMEEKGASSEQAKQLAEETAEEIWSNELNSSFADVAASLKEDYPDITDNQLKRAITIHEEGGYTIHEHELPEKPLRQQLESFKESGMWGVRLLSRRVELVCTPCREGDGRTYQIDEALDRMPIPHDNCTCPEEISRDAKRCGCTYMPLLREP